MKITERSSLDDLVLAAFHRAVAAKRSDVAEHLLKALEVLAKGDHRTGRDSDWLPQLAEAYLSIGKKADQ